MSRSLSGAGCGGCHSQALRRDDVINSGAGHLGALPWLTRQTCKQAKTPERSYAAQLPEKLNRLNRPGAVASCRVDEENFQTLHRMVHSLTGSGKTFGFSLLSDVARNLEEYSRNLHSEEGAERRTA